MLTVGRRVRVELGQRRPGSGAELVVERDVDADRFGDDPGADRELRAAEAQHDERKRDRHHCAEERRKDHRHIRVDAVEREPHGRIRAEADVGLQTDRYQAGVAGECVPHDRHQDERQQVRKILHDARTHDHGHEGEGNDQHAKATGEAGRERRPTLDPGTGERRRGACLGCRCHVVTVGSARRAPRALRRVSSPPRGEMRTTRNTMWPARIEYSGLICAPIV